MKHETLLLKFSLFETKFSDKPENLFFYTVHIKTKVSIFKTKTEQKQNKNRTKTEHNHNKITTKTFCFVVILL